MTVTFDKKPLTTPAAADFTVTAAVNGTTPVAVTVSAANVTADKEVALSVPSVVSQDAAQKVVYSVSYLKQAAVNSSAATVDALAIASVEATNSKTLTATFNKELTAAQKAAATFIVKYTNNAIAVNPVVWNGKTASFTRLDGGKLNVGAYTVQIAVTGFANTIAGTGTVAAETATKMELTTVRVQKAASQAISYNVYNQYNELMTVDATSFSTTSYNTTDPSRAAVVTTLGNINFSAANLGDVVRINAQLASNPAVNASATVTVTNITVGTVSLADPVLPTGAARLQVGLSGVSIVPTIADNFGNAMTLAARAAFASGTTLANGLIVTYSNITAGSLSIDANGKFLFDTTGMTAGISSITITNPSTGAVVTKTFTLLAAPDTASISLTAPTTAVRFGTDKDITFEIKDQYGAVATPGTFAGWATTDVQLGSTNPAVATVSWVGNIIRIHPVATGTATIYATVATPFANPAAGVATLTITVQATATPSIITVNGTPTISLAQGQTVLAAAETGALKFNITDQDGNAVNLAAAAGVKANITVTNSVAGVLTAPVASVIKAADMSATVGLTNGIQVVAGAVNGTATVTAQLFNDANNNNTMDAGEALTSTASVTYTVATPVLTQGSLSAAASGNAVATSNATGSVVYSDHQAHDGAIEYTYALLDQAGNALTTSVDNTVTWTITNNGTEAIKVNDGTEKTLAAGATATYTTTAAAGAGANATIIIIGAAEGKVAVSAIATGATTATTSTLYYTEQMVGASQVFNGTVVGYDKTANFMVLNTAVGYVVVGNYAAAGTFTAASYTVDGSSATVAQFETNLTAGDLVSITTNGTPDITVALTNK